MRFELVKVGCIFSKRLIIRVLLDDFCGWHMEYTSLTSRGVIDYRGMGR